MSYDHSGAEHGFHSRRKSRHVQRFGPDGPGWFAKTGLGKDPPRGFFRAGGNKRFQSQVMPLATWKRRKTKLSAGESERTERLARVVATALMIWNGDEAATREWLKRPHLELENVPPLEAALTEIGARRVEAVLTRAFYGLPA